MQQKDLQSEKVNSATLGKLLGVNVRTIQRLNADGVFNDVGEGRSLEFGLMDAVQDYIEYIRAGSQGGDDGAEVEKLKKQKLEAEIALKESQGELHEMKTRLFRGEIIEIDQVEDDYKAFFRVFKRLISSIAPRVAGQLSGYTDAVTIRKIERDINDDLNRTVETFVVAGHTPDGGKA